MEKVHKPNSIEIYNKINFHNSVDKFTISIIIPVFKDYFGLNMTLDSISDRTCGKYQIEIIVINDGGHKEITEVCKRHRVKMVEIQPNSGSYFARNKGLEYSNGDIIVFIDADVIIPSDWLKQAISSIEKVDYLAANIHIDNNHIQTAVHSYQVSHSFPVYSYLEMDHFAVTAGLVIKRKLIERLGGFDTRLRSNGDKEFGFRVFNAGYKQDILDTPPLIHPPKTLSQLIRKVKRIKRGHEFLAILYPKTYSRPNLCERLCKFLQALLPPKPKNIHRQFSTEDGISLIRKLFFLWLLKFFRGFYDLQVWGLRYWKSIPSPNPKVTFFDYNN